MRVLVTLPTRGCRRWQVEVVTRLAAVGHTVSIRHATTKTSATRGLEAVLAMESRYFGSSLASICEPLPATEVMPADLVIDLAGSTAERNAPVLTTEFCDCDSFPAGLSAMIASGGSPELVARINGAIVARARPMV